MNKLLMFFLMIGIFIAGADCVRSQNSEINENPATALTSYYALINRKNYKQAFEYWKNPTQTFDDFVKGYAETKSVRLIINQENPVEGAAGSSYSTVPTVLISTMKNGSQQTFFGCYTLRKSNLRPPDIEKSDTWHIYKGELKLAPQNSDPQKLLLQGCGENSDANGNDESGNENSARVLGVLGFDSKTAENSVNLPQNIQVNTDFEITITTSGNGCVSAAETGVVLTENTADIFVYDFTAANRPGIACTMIFKELPHKATLKFTKSGEAAIRVWGRKQGGNSPFGEPLVIEKRVTVR